MKPTFWDAYFSVPEIQINGVALPMRSILNIIGASGEDDEANQRTNLTLSGGGDGSSVVTLADADYTLLEAEYSKPIIKLTGTNTTAHALTFPLPAAGKHYYRVFELWFTGGGNVQLKMSSGFTWTIPGFFGGSGTIVHALFTSDGVTLFGPPGNQEGQIVVLGTTGYFGAATNLRYDGTTDTVWYKGARANIRPVITEAQIATASLTTLVSYAMANERQYAFDTIVTVARRTNLTKSARFKRSFVYRRSGGAPVLVGAVESGTDQKEACTDTLTIDTDGATAPRIRITPSDTDPRNVTIETRIQETSSA